MRAAIGLLLLSTLVFSVEPRIPEPPPTLSATPLLNASLTVSPPCGNIFWVPRREMGRRNLTLMYTRGDEDVAGYVKCVLSTFMESVPRSSEVYFHVEAVNVSELCEKLHKKTFLYGAINLVFLVSSSQSDVCGPPEKKPPTVPNVVQIFNNGSVWKAEIEGVTSSMRVMLHSDEKMKNSPSQGDVTQIVQMAIAMWRPRLTFDIYPMRYKSLSVQDQKIVTDKFTWTTGYIVGVCLFAVAVLVGDIVMTVLVRRKIRQQKEKELRLRAAMNESDGLALKGVDAEPESEPGSEGRSECGRSSGSK
ncbi:hypothetical protein QR680_018416 [Steinernema hermaphroditum]|uniref:Uncharacterized protein n=1 Tax=Steinernema hermaphroditum TaxID=289476 RepID=A0AA39HK81_9BILA|nr:hypothetical protein QR680_018416 [Steinernema hermaphroditum]